MIGATGATGTIGSELDRQLSDDGWAVRAFTRRPDEQDAMDGVEWVEADLSQRAALPAVFDGAAAPAVPPHRQHRRHGPAPEERDPGGGGERCRAGGEVVHSAAGDGAIPFIDTRDIAAVADVVLTEDGHAGETYPLTGPEAVSYRKATQTLARILERDLEYRAASLDEAWRRRRDAGQPVWLAAAQLAIAEYQRAGGPTARTTDTVETITGRAPRSLEPFVRDHAELLSAG